MVPRDGPHQLIRGEAHPDIDVEVGGQQGEAIGGHLFGDEDARAGGL